MNAKKAKKLRKQLACVKVPDREYEIRQMKVMMWEVLAGCEKTIEDAGFEIINYPLKDGTTKRMVAGFSTQVRLKEGCRRKMYKDLKESHERAY